jgi:hypothetical protein
MSGDEHSFLRRWSRLKRQRPRAAVTPAELPALEALTFESDFGAFMRAKVDEGVRRAALKKLFSNPRFNIMDGLDVYIDDYSQEDPIPAAMLAGLQHARHALFGPPAEKDETQPAPTSSNEPPQDPPQPEPQP